MRLGLGDLESMRILIMYFGLGNIFTSYICLYCYCA